MFWMETWYEDVVLGTWVKSSILFSRDKASDLLSAQKISLVMIFSTMFLSKTVVMVLLSKSKKSRMEVVFGLVEEMYHFFL